MCRMSYSFYMFRIEWFVNPPADAYDCTHPNKCAKNFNPQKVEACCLTINRGRPCPFLVINAARDGREDDQELFTKTTRSRRRNFPGE